MGDLTHAELTRIADDLGDMDDQMLVDLLPRVYEELRRLSQAYLSRERADHTLQATALVHEAYMHLANGEATPWVDHRHFFRVAAKTMRRILINHAARKRAHKRGGDRDRVTITEAGVAHNDSALDVIDLDEALCQLAKNDPVKAQIIELRFFAGCTIDETANVMEMSTATVERSWRFARAWLRSELAS